ncbi:MAG: DUF3817 domain-containing protein [Desulfobulbaceae bacterium]|nr:DUF3817 domain-containing protein [Desulfobulbaceae bacterium]
MDSFLPYFRKISIIEGCSLLTLLFLAMPAKYYWGYPAMMPVVGWGHGVLFLVFLVSSLVISHRMSWSIGFWLLVFFSSLLPFGTFVLDLKLRKMSV